MDQSSLDKCPGHNLYIGGYVIALVYSIWINCLKFSLFGLQFAHHVILMSDFDLVSLAYGALKL